MPTELIDQSQDDHLPFDAESASVWMQGVLATLADPTERRTAWVKDAEGRDLTRIRAERVELTDGSHVVNFILTFAE